MLELKAVSIPSEATFILAFCRHFYGTQHHSTLSQWEAKFLSFVFVIQTQCTQHSLTALQKCFAFFAF